eukprot:scaffold290516_cov24-Tisochrysis_lutea.AAC.2
MEAHQPVDGDPREERCDERLRQLDHALGKEEDGTVEREAQQQRLGRLEHAADGHLREATKVRHCGIVRGVHIADAQENEGKEEIEQERCKERGDEPRLVAPHAEELAAAEGHQLTPEGGGWADRLHKVAM